MAGTEYKISDEAVRVAASASRAARGGISGHNDTQRPRRNEQTFDLSISTMTSTSTFGCVAMNAAPSNARGISDSIALSNHQVSSSENMGSDYPLPISSPEVGAFEAGLSNGLSRWRSEISSAMNAAPSNVSGISESIALSNQQMSSSEIMGYYPLPISSPEAGALEAGLSNGLSRWRSEISSALNAAPSNGRAICESIALSNDQVFSSIDLSNHQVSSESSENMGSYYPLPNSSFKAEAFSEEECSGGYLCAVYETLREERGREGGREGGRELFMRESVCEREREDGV